MRAHPGGGARVSGIDDCLRQAMAIPGAIGASVVDYTTGLALGWAGRAPTDDPGATPRARPTSSTRR